MKATLVFKSHESIDMSIGMVFIPCICWVINNKTILNPHPDNPNYLKGDFQTLLKQSIFDNLTQKKIILVIHEDGHGTSSDIDNLIDDIKSEGFNLKLVNI